MNPLFSIIIPTYNRADLIETTLRSLTNQTYTDFEIIVVDDGGRDHTKAVVESIEDSRISYYWKENAERGAARNYGANLARGKYFNFFDSDDIAFENHIHSAFSFFHSPNNRNKILHTSYCYSLNGNKYNYNIIEGILNSKILKSNCLSCNNVFIPKEIFSQEKFSENRALSASEDWELWIRISQKNEIIGTKDVTSAIIQHNMRSMITASGESTEVRAVELLKEIRNTRELGNSTSNIEHNVVQEMYSLSSLHYAIEGNKSDAIRCLKLALKANNGILFTRRFLAILKYLFRPSTKQ